MAKPTPGPWQVQRESAIDYRPNMIVGADGASLVAWCAGGGPKRAVMRPEEDANARLIAAAPDLLEALAALEAVCPEQLGCGLGCQSQHELAQDRELAGALAKARAAISKAEGR